MTLFKKSLRQTVKGNVNTNSPAKTHKRAKIKAFSYKSRQRLKLTCEQGGYKVKSQFCMTYHNDWPTDGKVLKRHLDNFLRALRRKFSGVDYVWVVEVQKRGAPHYHLCLPFSHEDKIIHQWLAETWNRIAAPDDLNHLAVHLHAKSFYAWDMENSSYLTKYLGKEGQKEIPEHFIDFGRFWGCSTNFADKTEDSSWKEFEHLSYSSIDLQTGEDQSFEAPMWLRRQLAKYHRAQLRRYGKRSKLSGKVHRQSFTLTNGRVILDQLTTYLERQPPRESPPPF